MIDTAVTKAMQLVIDQLRAGKTRAWIAAEIGGFGASHVRRYVLGHYAGKANKNIEAAIIKRFDRRICPYDGTEKQPIQCERTALRGRPHGFPDAENLWLTCQTCPHSPKAGKTTKEGTAS